MFRSARRLGWFVLSVFAAVATVSTGSALAGSGWTDQKSGTSLNLAGVSFADDLHGWAVGANGVIVATSDGGISWRAQDSGFTDTLRDVAFADASNGFAVGVNPARILHTTDGGASWQPEASGITDPSFTLSAVAVRAGSSDGWAVGPSTNNSSIVHTADGATWTGQGTFSDVDYFTGVAVTDASHVWAVGLASSGPVLVASADGGASWTETFLPTTDVPRGLAFASNTQGWIVGDSGLILSTSDGGANWSTQTSGTTARLYRVAFPTATDGWAVGADGTIVATSDGGQTWARQSSGTTETLFGVSFPDTHQGWAVGVAGTIVKFDSRRSTSTAVSCAPNTLAVGQPTRCTATVTDTDAPPATAPTGAVAFSSSDPGDFPGGASCGLAATGRPGEAACTVTYTPAGQGTPTLTAGYPGDATHAPSSNSTTLTVQGQVTLSPPRNIVPPSIQPDQSCQPRNGHPHCQVIPYQYVCDPGQWTGNDPGIPYQFEWQELYYIKIGKNLSPSWQTVGNDQSYYAFTRVSPYIPSGIYRCVVTATGPGGSTAAASATKQLQVGPSLPVGVHLPTPVDVHITGIEVTQGIQEAPCGGCVFSDPNHVVCATCYAGTLPSRDQANGDTPGDADYRGVTLAAGKQTVVRVYANVTRVSGSLTKASAQLEVLDSSGQQVYPPPRTAPLTPDVYPPALQQPTPDCPLCVDLATRASPGSSFYFLIPAQETFHRSLTFRATVSPPGPPAGGQCGGCNGNVFTLHDVPFKQPATVTIWPIPLDDEGIPGSPRTGQSLSQIFGSMQTVYPNPVRVLPWDGNLNVAGLGTDDAVEAVEDRASDNNLPSSVYPVGVFFRGESGGLGGTTPNGPGRLFTDDGPPVSIAGDYRPLTMVAHEIGHGMALGHADDSHPHPDGTSNCGGDLNGQHGEGWPPDYEGRIQGVGLDLRAFRQFQAGSLPSTFVEGFDHQGNPAPGNLTGILGPGSWGSQYFDFMSYCPYPPGSGLGSRAPGQYQDPEPVYWISPHNWQRLLDYHAPTQTLPAAADAQASAALANPLRVIATVKPDGTVTIHDVTPGKRLHLRPTPGSPYRIELRDAAGRVLTSVVPATVPLHTDGVAHQDLMLAATLPFSSGTAAVVITAAGHELARRTRSAHAPTGRFVSPRAGARVGRARTTVVRWTQHDADGDHLTADVDYSANGGRTWRVVASRVMGTSATIPSRLLSMSGNARLRVRISDGFNVTTLSSGRFRAAGAPPIVQIIGASGRAGVPETVSLPLEGAAYDDAGTPLTGRHLTWYLGKRRIGHGEFAIADQLPVGNTTIRLVATDSHGRTTQAILPLRVSAVVAHYLFFDAPLLVSARARSVRITIAASAPATFTIAGRRYAVDSRPRTVTVSIRRSRSPIVLPCSLRSPGGVVRGTYVAVRPSGQSPEARRSPAVDGLAALPAAARAVVAARLGAADRHFWARRVGAGATFSDPRAGIDVQLSRTGAVVRAGALSWSLGLRAVGRGSHLDHAAAASPTVGANHVTLRHAEAVQERYDYGPLGLEQSFTIGQRPPGPAGSAVVLLLGDLPHVVTPIVAADGQSVSLARHGREVLRYWGLFASDARGRVLPARIMLLGRALSLRVDDRAARYPVRVDPFAQGAELTASDGAAGDALGTSVAISGDTIVAGAPSASVGGNIDQGAVYVFVKPAGGWTNGSEVAKLTASDGATSDQLGGAVAISGDTIIAGASFAAVGGQSQQGAAYVFVKPNGGWVSGHQTAKLTHGVAGDRFGFSVALSPDAAVVGVPFEGNGSGNNTGGSVYVYAKPAGGWTDSTTPTARLAASDGVVPDAVGYSVAIDGDTIVAGAESENIGGNTEVGALYVFAKPADGWASGTETKKLVASDGAAGNQLGYSVAISGDTVAAGAPFPNGAVYVFVKPANGWANAAGTETAKLTASDPAAAALGWSTAISGDAIVAGARGAAIGASTNQGELYVFVKPGGGWKSGRETQQLTASDGTANDGLGFAADIGGGTIVGGAPGASQGTGAAYVFTSTGQAATTTTVGCQPGTVPVGGTTSCTATVADAGGTAASGSVAFSSDSSGTFDSGGACTLAPTGNPGEASCHVVYTPTAVGSGTHTITAAYGGDNSHASSNGTSAVTVTQARNVTATFTPGTPPVHAVFAVPVSSHAASWVTLDASGTTGAQSLRWDLNGDGTPDVTCDGRTPRLAVRLARTTSVSLTAIAADGSNSTATHVAGVVGAGQPPAATSRFLGVAECQGPASNIDITANGGPPAGCTSDVTFDVVSAIGCLDLVTDPAKVPAREAAVLEDTLRQYEGSTAWQAFGSWFCRNVANCTSVQLTHHPITWALQTSGLWVSRQPVRIDGVDFYPARGAAIVLAPGVSRVVSSNATVKVGGLTVRTGPVNLDTSGGCGLTCASSMVAIASMDTSGLPLVGGFGFRGQASLSFVHADGQNFGQIDGQVQLPAILSGASVNAQLRVTNANGIELENFHAHLDELGFQGIGLSNVSIDFSRPATWSFVGDIGIGEATIRLEPSPLNGIFFDGGGLRAAGATLDFNGTGPEIFPGVQLNRITLGFYTGPTVLRGALGLRVLGLAEVDGKMVLAFPSLDAPFTPAPTDLPGAPSSLTHEQFTNGPVIGLGGDVAVEVPALGRLELGGGYLLYDFPGYVAVGAFVKRDFFGVLHIEGGVDGAFNASNGNFNVEGHAQVCLPDPIGCGGADAVVSDQGIGACLGNIGGGFQWASFPNPFIYVGWPGKDCDPERFREDNVFAAADVRTARASAAQLTHSYLVTLKPGQPTRLVRLDGSTGAPNISVVGPGGQALRTGSLAAILKSRSIIVVPVPKLDTTLIGLASTVPGTYTITPLPGPTIIHSYHADEPPAARVTATVSGTGTHRVLSYYIRYRPDQKITFSEVSPQGTKQIATITGGGRGKLRFLSAPGGGRRRIEAAITLAGMPVPDAQHLLVTTFQAPAVIRPGLPAPISFHWRHGTLIVGWGPATGAGRYLVTLRERHGGILMATVPASRHAVTFNDAHAYLPGTATVRAVTPYGTTGPPRTTRYSSATNPPNRFLPFSQLGQPRCARAHRVCR
jgi:photosystem II stability/assembly factor-like uncharacterized protein